MKKKQPRDIVDRLEELASREMDDLSQDEAIPRALLDAAMAIRWLRAELDDAGIRHSGSLQ